MNAVILAAGDGGRLLPHTAHVPKPLLVLRGRPLIHHVLGALGEAGIDDATIVVGHRGEQIRRAVTSAHPAGMAVRFVENDAYMLGNARSLWAARPTQRGPFLLAMADHIIEPELARRVIDAPGGRTRLAVERARRDDPRAPEATRALVRRGSIHAIGKTITTWNALDTGVFWCTPAVFRAMTPGLRDGEAGAVFAALAAQGELDAVDVSGLRWADVDTAADLRAADAVVASLYDDGAHARSA